MRQAARNVTVVMEKGDPAEVIVRVVEREGCDLIVTGIARDETLGRFGLGTTVDRLLRRSIVPVLIVKQRARSPYRNIVVATDLSDSSRRALQVAMALFPDHKLGVFHAYEAPRADLMSEPARHQEAYRKTAAAECAAFLAESGIPDERWRSFSILVEPGSPIDLVHQYVRDRKVDLVVLGTHGRSALFNILIGSTAQAILSSLPCDALVAREPRSAEGSRRS
jgi:nucleotide-binding universal stress UspA family protein